MLMVVLKKTVNVKVLVVFFLLSPSFSASFSFYISLSVSLLFLSLFSCCIYTLSFYHSLSLSLFATLSFLSLSTTFSLSATLSFYHSLFLPLSFSLSFYHSPFLSLSTALSLFLSHQRGSTTRHSGLYYVPNRASKITLYLFFLMTYLGCTFSVPIVVALTDMRKEHSLRMKSLRTLNPGNRLRFDGFLLYFLLFNTF